MKKTVPNEQVFTLYDSSHESLDLYMLTAAFQSFASR